MVVRMSVQSQSRLLTWVPIALLVPTLVPALLFGPFPKRASWGGGSRAARQEDSRNEFAYLALERAERSVAQGRYDRAYAEYQRLAERYPGTPAGSIAARRAGPNGFLGEVDLRRVGPSPNRLDIILMAEGFPLADQRDFVKRVADVPKTLLSEPVFAEYRQYWNVIRAHYASRDAGVSGAGMSYSTALGARRVSAGPVPFVAVAPGTVAARLDALRAHDHSAVVFLATGAHGSASRGVATIGQEDQQHLMAALGHSLAGLLSERAAATGLQVISGPIARAQRPLEGPNVSTTDAPGAVPWTHWLDTDLRGIGVHEGADGQLRSRFRGSDGECWMGEPGASRYCAICREAVVLALYDYVDPIERAEPRGHPSSLVGVDDYALAGPGPHRFELALMKPQSHGLRIRWWLIESGSVPRAMAIDDRSASRPRRIRGPLPAIDAQPVRQVDSANGKESFQLAVDDMAPGLYRLICRVEDDSTVRGTSSPWVLEDPRDLLHSERGWWVRVD